MKPDPKGSLEYFESVNANGTNGHVSAEEGQSKKRARS